MVSQKVTINNPQGLHMRPAGVFAKGMAKFDSDVTINFNGKATKEGIIGTLKYSILEVRYQIKSTFLSLKYLITGRFKLNDLSGPVGIVNMIGNTYEQSIVYGIKTVVLSLLNFAIMLSANLGVMNLLPLPALDGGRLVFIILEMIRRKKVSPEKEGMVHFAGLVLLMALMVIVMANDIKNIFFI